MPQTPADTSTQALAEIRRLCRTVTAHFEDPGARPRLDAAASCLWAAYGLTCRVTCGAPESTARIERAQRHYQEHQVPPHEQLQELAGQIASEVTGPTVRYQEAPLLGVAADSLRAAMAFLVSVLGDMPPRLGADLAREYVQRADAAYRALPGTRGPAATDPVHAHLQHASGISRQPLHDRQRAPQ